jgi:hypothetical protein
MKSGAQVGLAVTAGYVLGRFHKMKWALALATMAGRKRLQGGLVQQGTKLLKSSPELTKLTDNMRGSLMEAGKTAAVAALSKRISSLSAGLTERTESMRTAGMPGGTGDGGPEEEDRDREAQAANGRSEADDADEADADEADAGRGRREADARRRPAQQGTRSSHSGPQPGNGRPRSSATSKSAGQHVADRPRHRSSAAEDEEAEARPGKRRSSDRPSGQRLTTSRSQGGSR